MSLFLTLASKCDIPGASFTALIKSSRLYNILIIGHDRLAVIEGDLRSLDALH